MCQKLLGITVQNCYMESMRIRKRTQCYSVETECEGKKNTDTESRGKEAKASKPAVEAEDVCTKCKRSEGFHN